MNRSLEERFRIGLLRLRSLEEVLRAVVGTIYDAGFDRVRIYLLTANRLYMDCWACTEGKAAAWQTRSLANDPYLQLLLREPWLHIFEQPAGCLSPFDALEAGPVPTKWACIPLLCEGEIIGKLSVDMDNQLSGRPLDHAQLELLTQFAPLAAVAIEAACQREMLDHIQHVLLDFSHELLRLYNRQEVLHAAVDLARRELGTEYASVVLAEQEGRLLTYETSGWEPGIAQNYRPELGNGSHAGHTMLVQQPVIVPDYAYEKRFIVPAIVPEHGIRSGVSVPLKQAHGLAGAILLQTTRLRVFSEVEVYFLAMLADQLSLAIQRDQHYESSQTMQGLLAGRTAVAWMGLVSSVWNHRIAGHVNTIGAIAESVQTQADLPGSHKYLPDWVREYLKRIESVVRQINRSPLALPASVETSAPVSVNVLIRHRLQELWQDPAYNCAALKQVPDPQAEWMVRISPEWLERALEILVHNAVKAVRELPLTRRHVGVQTRAVGGYLQIVVSDNGPGIPADVRESLFSRKKDSTAGLGMGLLIAQVIAEQNGGGILLGQTGVTGTEMILQLPLVTNRPFAPTGATGPFE